MKLSIIIPYYNSKEYTDELLDRLAPQITEDVEIIVVDDGSKKRYKSEYELEGWLTIIHKRNGGCASARNRGLKIAKGEYIQFIDSDDMVPEYFIEKLLKKTEGGYDVIDYSWKSLTNEGNQHNYKLNSDNDYLRNPSVCTRCFKRSFISNRHFNELKDSTEDEDFSRKLGYLDKDTKMHHGSIPEYMYFYRTAVDNSKIKRFKAGLMRTKRVTYYVEHVTEDMTDLLNEIIEQDKQNEVWLLTNRNDIPNLKRYCQISRPMRMWTHYLIGGCPLVTVLSPPIKCDVVIYCEYCNKVGGISTFIYNWCQHMHKYYDIIVMYNNMDSMQVDRLKNVVRCIPYNANTPKIVCETVILNRLTDKIPDIVTYKKSIQICHACVQLNYRIPQDRDYLVNVSKAAKDSWKQESAHGIVIHNMSYQTEDKALILISATRVGAYDKGENDRRIIRLIKALDKQNINYIWLNFSDGNLGRNISPHFINMPAIMDVQPYIKKADYLVQLSDKEAYSYSILEALTNNTAVIVTPFESVIEQGFVEGMNGYMLPFDFSENMDMSFIKAVPHFTYEYDNKSIIKQWKKLLEGKMEVPHSKNADWQQDSKEGNEVIGDASGQQAVMITRTYKDIALGRVLIQGAIEYMDKDRAVELENKGFVRILGGN